MTYISVINFALAAILVGFAAESLLWGLAAGNALVGLGILLTQLASRPA